MPNVVGKRMYYLLRWVSLPDCSITCCYWPDITQGRRIQMDETRSSSVGVFNQIETVILDPWWIAAHEWQLFSSLCTRFADGSKYRANFLRGALWPSSLVWVSWVPFPLTPLVVFLLGAVGLSVGSTSMVRPWPQPRPCEGSTADNALPTGPLFTVTAVVEVEGWELCFHFAQLLLY